MQFSKAEALVVALCARIGRLAVLLAIALVTYSDNIVCADMIEFAKLYQIFNTELGTTALNVVIPLLRFVDSLCNLKLGQVVILAQIAQTLTIVHVITVANITYSIIEYLIILKN